MQTLDSHSPSREFMLLGEYVGDGFEIGIINSLPKVKQAAQTMGDTVLDAMGEFVRGTDQVLADLPDRVQAITERTADQMAASAARIQDLSNSLLPNSLFFTDRGRRDDFTAGQDAANVARDRARSAQDLERSYQKSLLAETKSYQKALSKAKTDEDRAAIEQAHKERQDDLAQQKAEQIAEMQERQKREDEDRAWRKQQQLAVREFEDMIREESIKRQIEAEQKKQEQILLDDQAAREKLGKETEKRLKDLKEKFLDKLPEQITDPARVVIDTFLDGVTKKASEKLGEIITKAGKAAAALAAVGGAIPGGGDEDLTDVDQEAWQREHGNPNHYIGERAAGGSVWGGSPYLVGERGPEIFVPSGAGNIVPNGGGGMQVVIQITGNTMLSDSESTARRLAELLAPHINRRVSVALT